MSLNNSHEYRIQQLEQEVLKRKLLWENTDTTKDFVAQTIQLSSNKYDALIIVTRNTTNSSFYNTTIVARNYRSTLSNSRFANEETAVRSMSFNNSDMSKIEIENAQYFNGTTVSNNANNYCIPVAIYAI